MEEQDQPLGSGRWIPERDHRKGSTRLGLLVLAVVVGVAGCLGCCAGAWVAWQLAVTR